MTTTLLSQQILKIMRLVQYAVDVSVWLTEYLSGVIYDRQNIMAEPVINPQLDFQEFLSGACIANSCGERNTFLFPSGNNYYRSYI